MIKIFNPTDTDFTSAGNICINPLKCIETKSKSLNGWNLSVEVDINYQEYIKKDYLVVCKTKSLFNPQAFRINSNIEYTSNKISFTADHVYCDSENYFLLDVRPTKLNAISSLEYVNERTDKKSPFSVYSDIDSISTSYFIRKNLLEAWEIFEERYSGYFQFDNWKVNLIQNISRDTGIIISYSQYLESLNIIEDWSNVVTRLYPTGPNGIMLDEKYLDADVQYDVPYTKTIQFDSDIEFDLQTDENLKQELKEKAIKYINENKYPKISYEVQSNVNQELDIGYMVQIKHPLVDITVEVIEYQYDLNLGKTISLVFGNFTRDVKKKFDSIKQEINSQAEKISSQGKLIQEQTNLINSLNKNGHVYISDNEVLILDKLPKENAKNVWRWGLGGLGFSSQGYEGPFSTAITQDGKINADFILAGKINTNLIEGYDQLVTKVSKTEETVEDITTTTQTSTGGNSLYLKDVLESNALEYSVDGRCEQETRSGKNLYNFKDTTVVGAGITTDEDGWITITADNTSGTDVVYRNYYTKNLNLKTNTNYKVIMEVKNASATGDGNIYPISILSNTGGQFIHNSGYALKSLSNNSIKQFTILTKASFENITDGLRTFASFGAGTKGSITFRLSVLEDTTVTAETFKYEAFGASPSPDYPSEIETVKGIRNLFDYKNASILNAYIGTADNQTIITAHGYNRMTYLHIKPNTTYTVSKLISQQFSLGYCTEEPVVGVVCRGVIDGTKIAYDGVTRHSLTITTDDNANYLVIRYINTKNEPDIDLETILKSIQVEQGSVAHSCVPYGTYEKIKVTGKNAIKNTNVATNNSDYWSSYSTFDESTGTLTRSTSTTTESFITYLIDGMKSNTTYTLSCLAKSNGYVKSMDMYMYALGAIGLKNKGNISLTTDFKKYTFTFTTDKNIDYSRRSIIRFDNNGSTTSGTVATLTIKDVMLCEETNDDYEPYKEKEVLIDLAKENLLETPYTESNKLTATATRNDYYAAIDYYAELEAGKTYTFSCKTDGTFGTNNQQTECYLLFDKKYDYIIHMDDKNCFTFTPTQTGKYYVRYDVNVKGETHSFWDFAIYKGTNADDSYELNSIGDTKDKLEIINGVVDIQKRIGKIVLNGNENWYKAEKGYLIQINNNPFANNNSPFGYCDKFKFQNSYATWTNQYYCGFNSANVFWIRDDFAIATTVEDFKSWLKANPVTVYYILNEPETITLPNTNIPLYEGVNHVTLVEDLETTTSIKYLRKTPISGEYALNQDLNKTNSNLADTNNQLNQTQSDINATNTNLNNNHYNKEQIDSMNSTTTKNITQIRNTMEQNITSTNASISKIQETIENGVSKVITTTGTFDENGLNISKSGQQMSTTVDWEGLEVIRDKGKSTESEVLTVRPDKVASKNMEVRTYFTQKPIRNEQCVSITDGKSVGYGTYWIGEE